MTSKRNQEKPTRVRRSLGELSLCAALEAGARWTPEFHQAWCEANGKDRNAAITVRAELLRALVFVEGAHRDGAAPPAVEAEQLDRYSLDSQRRYLAQALIIDWVTQPALVDRGAVEAALEAGGAFEDLKEEWWKDDAENERERRIVAEVRFKAYQDIANRPQVRGDLDLTGACFSGGLVLRGCVWPGEEGDGGEGAPPSGALILDQAQLGALDLSGAALGELRGDRLRVREDTEAPALNAERANLRGARIGGGLYLQRARFRAERGEALTCNAAEVGAAVLLHDGFQAQAEVSFLRARIGGQLSCTGGRFLARSGLALNCNAAEIGADVFLRDGFHASADVNFARARIAGQLSCVGGRFLARLRRALHCDAVEIAADVFLRDGFHASAEVNFARARIGGNLQIRGGVFRPASAGGSALNLNSAMIGAALIFDEPWSSAFPCAQVAGSINLSNAHCAVLHDGDIRDQPGGAPSWLAPDARLILDGFTYGRLGSNSPTFWEAREAWLDRQSDEDRKGEGFKPQPFEQLSKVLREMGHTSDARHAALSRQWRVHRSGNLSWPSWLFRWVVLWPTGYGYRPQWPALGGLALAVFAFFVFASAYRQGYITPAQPHAAIAQISAGLDGSGAADCLAADRSESVPPFHAGAYVIDAFVPLVDIDQESSWKPARTARCNGDPVVLAQLDGLNPGWMFDADGPSSWWNAVVLQCTIATRPERVNEGVCGLIHAAPRAFGGGVALAARHGGLLWLQWILIFFGFAISALIAASLSGLIRRD